MCELASPLFLPPSLLSSTQPRLVRQILPSSQGRGLSPAVFVRGWLRALGRVPPGVRGGRRPDRRSAPKKQISITCRLIKQLHSLLLIPGRALLDRGIILPAPRVQGRVHAPSPHPHEGGPRCSFTPRWTPTPPPWPPGPHVRRPRRSVDTVSLTVHLPEPLWRAVELCAAGEGNANAVIARALEEYLLQSHRQRMQHGRDRDKKLVEALSTPVEALQLSARTATPPRARHRVRVRVGGENAPGLADAAELRREVAPGDPGHARGPGPLTGC